MTPKQLLQPRYEVIADYPSSPFKVGEILEYINGWICCYGEKFEHIGDLKYIDRYPHLYRRLEWWEHRKPEDMPEYVIKPTTKQVFKVDKYDLETNTIYVDGGCPFTYTSFIQTKMPATLKDYTDYLTKNNQQ